MLGGCSAAVQPENVPLEGYYHLGPQSGIRAITGDELLNTLKTMKNGRAVPSGRIPKEVWQLILSESTGPRDYLIECLRELTELGKLPRRWQEALAFQLSKMNGLPKCEGIRLINLLCPMGKAIF